MTVDLTLRRESSKTSPCIQFVWTNRTDLIPKQVLRFLLDFRTCTFSAPENNG